MESLFAEPRNWVALSFVLFFVLVGRTLWGVITGLLDRRIAEVGRELEEARRLRQEAEAMLADAHARRQAALTDAQALLVGAKSEAERVAREGAADAVAAAKRRERVALARISAAEKAAVHEVRMTAADVAAAAAEAVIREGLNSDADAALIDRAIGNVPGALAEHRVGLAGVI
jgi:F-type H+-transporting ATPase subunit b